MENSSLKSEDPVCTQYERFPYPPLPWFALPKTNLRESRFDVVTGRSAQDIRILVAGSGTFEALGVARLHPYAREVLAFDFSASSLLILKKRARFSRVMGYRQAPLGIEVGDLESSEVFEKHRGSFDFVTASNVLHHLKDPALGLAHLATTLKENGIMRVSFYPARSRLFLREASQYLRDAGLTQHTPRLRSQVRLALSKLPKNHRVRQTVERHPESRTEAGLVDAFFHARETLYSCLQWGEVFERLGLEVIEESQQKESQSVQFDLEYGASNPKLTHLKAQMSRFEKLELLDAFFELHENPILWLRKKSAAIERKGLEMKFVQDLTSFSINQELLTSLDSIQRVLSKHGVDAKNFLRSKRESDPYFDDLLSEAGFDL